MIDNLSVSGVRLPVRENTAKHSADSGSEHKTGRSVEIEQQENTAAAQVDENIVIDAIESANKSLESTGTEFEFSIHEETKAIMVKVKNKETGEVIKEIPNEKILDMVAKMWEMAGIFVDERV